MSALTLIPESHFLCFTRESVQTQIREWMSQEPEPFKNAIRLELFDEFGSGGNWRSLREQIRGFVKEVRRTRSSALSQWAVFSGPQGISQVEFEIRLWNELSLLTSEEERDGSWRSGCAARDSSGFEFSIEDVGLTTTAFHPQHVVRHRRFPWPALCFTVRRWPEKGN